MPKGWVGKVSLRVNSGKKERYFRLVAVESKLPNFTLKSITRECYDDRYLREAFESSDKTMFVYDLRLSHYERIFSLSLANTSENPQDRYSRRGVGEPARRRRERAWSARPAR